MMAAQKRVEASASNIANISTTGTLEGGPNQAYSALTTTQTSRAINGESAGVQANITKKNPGFVPAFDPGSPFANEEGIIGAPNVALAEEAVNLQLAETTYKANIQSLKTADELSDEVLRILDDQA